MGNPEPADKGPTLEPTPAFARDLHALFDDGATLMSAPKIDAAIAKATKARAANLRRAKLIKWTTLSGSGAVAAALVLVALWPGAAPSTPRASAPLATADQEQRSIESDTAVASAAEPRAEAEMAMADAAAPPSAMLGRAREAAKSELAEGFAMDALAQADPHDIDGNARVDILDAYAIARGVQAGNAPASWDFNGDGAVTQADADVVARRAVAL